MTLDYDEFPADVRRDAELPGRSTAARAQTGAGGSTAGAISVTWLQLPNRTTPSVPSSLTGLGWSRRTAAMTSASFSVTSVSWPLRKVMRVAENESEVAAAVRRDHPTRSSSRAPTAWCSSSAGAT